MNEGIRQPIVSVVGHVDHGKTSILDCFRGSSVQEGEAGGITQKISFTKYPLEKVKEACPLIEKSGVNLEIPGFLFIDTPGHAAFTNLRKRGGSLADLAILVVNIKEGIKPQTAEVLQILKAHKTPFLIALNKLDTISGWRYDESKGLKENIENQSINVNQEFQEALLTFQGSLSQHGFESDLFFEIRDFTKNIALVPCSAKTKQGISELLFVLAGLSQRFLKERLKLGDVPKGVILEVKKEKGKDSVEAIIYDGSLEEGDEIIVAALDGEPIVTKVRAIEEVEDLGDKYSKVDKAKAATGVKIVLNNKEGIVSGVPFQKLSGNLEEVKEEFKKEMERTIDVSKQGIIAKADSLGSLEALLTLLKEANIPVVKAGIGPIGKSDVISAKANLEINELDAAIVGFNVNVEDDLDLGKVHVVSDNVVYKLIDDISEWRANRAAEIEREKMLSLASVSKVEILKQYVFRNSNPAVFGVKVLGGTLKVGSEMIDETGESVARIKGLELDKQSVQEAEEGKELAVSLPGINFERRLKEVNYLYSNISERQFKQFKEHKELLKDSEKKVIQEIAEINRRKNEDWGL